MSFRVPTTKDKARFNRLATHPLQSWEWGEFRSSTGISVERLINKKSSFQVTFHPIPKTKLKVGYLPRSYMPNKKDLNVLKDLGHKHNAIFIKLEPNLSVPTSTNQELLTHRNFLIRNGCQLGRPMFTNYSFQIDLTQPEDKLLANMKSKTRYNIRLAQKKGVQVKVDNSTKAFDRYIDLWKQTTKRQNFFSHTESYHRKMWQHLNKARIAHLLRATYQEKTLVTWILFVFNKTLYYPYGASSNLHRELMASNLIMWEAIKFGKKTGCQIFDMWGSLGPNPDTSDPWYGFHRFKQGYGGELVEFVGSYDLVIKPLLYPLFRTAEKIRWFLLRQSS